MNQSFLHYVFAGMLLALGYIMIMRSLQQFYYAGYVKGIVDSSDQEKVINFPKRADV